MQGHDKLISCLRVWFWSLKKKNYLGGVVMITICSACSIMHTHAGQPAPHSTLSRLFLQQESIDIKPFSKSENLTDFLEHNTVLSLARHTLPSHRRLWLASLYRAVVMIYNDIHLILLVYQVCPSLRSVQETWNQFVMAQCISLGYISLWCMDWCTTQLPIMIQFVLILHRFASRLTAISVNNRILDGPMREQNHYIIQVVMQLPSLLCSNGNSQTLEQLANRCGCI